MENEVLTETLETIKEETSGTRVTLGELTETLNHRGFGALLLVPAMFNLLPTGAIPGVTAVSAVFICLLTGQMIAGRHHPWMPEKMKNLSLRRKKLVSAIEGAKPYTKICDRMIGQRFDFCSNTPMQRIIACICFLLGLIMIFIGFIPLMSVLISIPIIFFALALIARDGLLALIGFGMTSLALTVLIKALLN